LPWRSVCCRWSANLRRRGGAQNDLVSRYRGRILLNSREIAEERGGEGGDRLGGGGHVGRVLHDEESIDGAGQGRYVVEAPGICCRGGVGVHRDLPVRIDLVQSVGDRGDQASQPGLVGITRPSRSRFTPSKFLASTAAISAVESVVAAAGSEVNASRSAARSR